MSSVLGSLRRTNSSASQTLSDLAAAASNQLMVENAAAAAAGTGEGSGATMTGTMPAKKIHDSLRHKSVSARHSLKDAGFNGEVARWISSNLRVCLESLLVRRTSLLLTTEG